MSIVFCKLGLADSQAIHFKSFSSFWTRHVEHSQDPLTGLNWLPKPFKLDKIGWEIWEALLVTGGKTELDGDDLRVSQAAHLFKVDLFWRRQTWQSQTPASGLNLSPHEFNTSETDFWDAGMLSWDWGFGFVQAAQEIASNLLCNKHISHSHISFWALNSFPNEDIGGTIVLDTLFTMEVPVSFPVSELDDWGLLFGVSHAAHFSEPEFWTRHTLHSQLSFGGLNLSGHWEKEAWEIDGSLSASTLIAFRNLNSIVLGSTFSTEDLTAITLGLENLNFPLLLESKTTEIGVSLAWLELEDWLELIISDSKQEDLIDSILSWGPENKVVAGEFAIKLVE